MRSSRLLTTVIAAAGLAILAVPVAAQQPDVPPPREYGESGVDTGVVTVRAGSEWVPVGGGGGGGGSSCGSFSIDLIVEDDFRQPVNREWRIFNPDGSIPFTGTPDDLAPSLPTYMRHFSPTGRWFAVACDGLIRVLPEGGPPVNVAALVLQALDQLDPPEPELAMTPEGLHYTQLQSWLAIDPAYWDLDRRATASAGRVVVTATLTPADAEWDMGNGDTVVCDGPGTVWEPGLDEAGADCAYTYRETSAGAPSSAFDVTASVRFEVGLTTNAPGSYGPFPDVERATVEPVQVGEIQAVND